MKIAALATTLILGASSVALAAPAYAPSNQSLIHRRPDHVGWQTIAGAEKLTRGRDAVQLYTPIRASTLKLEATRGSTFVDKVEVTFANGRTQTIELDKRLGYGSPVIVDLNGRERTITRVVVTGRGGWYSSYKVLAA